MAALGVAGLGSAIQSYKYFKEQVRKDKEMEEMLAQYSRKRHKNEHAIKRTKI